MEQEKCKCISRKIKSIIKHEYFDLSTIEKECVDGPIDISSKGDRTIEKYIMKKGNQDQGIGDNNIVTYIQESWFDDGRICNLKQNKGD